ncbi:hypothetical protein AMJ44_11555 [candidate division WOR-1 bacterium DG_54_3]|uniref:Uncharacterized protein n=1 Tax=candidate division WOR-1 bacterium DG_54_3 TaxID=1703775 RepID=A0A0S7XSY0_UNCSA|nr:MAG: hypothetical protein AMJ44_11555 [candidate division WOR-1 bacterium DG_54_3]
MKRGTFFIVVLLLLANCTYNLRHYHKIERKDVIIVSERVGETIDAQEREHFGLFLGMDDFESARLYEVEGDGYDVEISAGHRRFVAYNRSPDALLILREYIEDFEVVKDSMPVFEKKWGIVDYDTLGQPITRREIEMNMAPKRGWRTWLVLTGATAGCVGSCLIFGAPSLQIDVPTDYDNSEDVRKGLINLGSTAAGGVSGWFIGSELDRRKALKMIKEARKPRVIEF